MITHHSNKKTIFVSGVILILSLFLRPPQAGSAGREEQKPTFSVVSSLSALRPDSAGQPVGIGGSRSGFFLSRIHPLGKHSLRDAQMPELEPLETYGSFFGLKLTLQIKGGWNTFVGGDIKNGVGGMFDWTAHLISVDGVPITRSQKQLPHDGLEFGGDLIFCITPRFGIGIGMSRFSAVEKNVLIYEIRSPDYERLNINPEVNVSVLRLGLFYAFPFGGRLAISVHGGPALYSAHYSYNMNLTSGSYGMTVIQAGFLPTGLYQDAEAKKMGLEGGVGFEFNANPFVAFFLEALGRVARIEGFEGKEAATLYQNYRREVLNQEGPLYLIDTDTYPLLDIVPPEGSAGVAARKAVLDFSGFSFSAGLKLRF